MRNATYLLFTLLFLAFGCSKDDDHSTNKEENTTPKYIETIDFSSTIDDISEIEDFDVEGEYLYFIYGVSIYSMNLITNTIEHIIEDNVDWPVTVKVIQNNLYYQGHWSWSSSSDIKLVDLNKIEEGVQSTNPIIGIAGSQLGKYSDHLLYVSRPDGFSPTNNFYELDQANSEKLIATAEFVHPRNMRVVENFLYFSSLKEIRRIDLNKPNEESVTIYSIPAISDITTFDGDILGFDIDENIIYFTQVSNNKIIAVDLDNPNEDPLVLKENNSDGFTGYGKLIISDGKLYAKKIEDKHLEVFEL